MHSRRRIEQQVISLPNFDSYRSRQLDSSLFGWVYKGRVNYHAIDYALCVVAIFISCWRLISVVSEFTDDVNVECLKYLVFAFTAENHIAIVAV